MFAGKKSAQIREILISESAWEEMTCLFAPSLGKDPKSFKVMFDFLSHYTHILPMSYYKMEPNGRGTGCFNKFDFGYIIMGMLLCTESLIKCTERLVDIFPDVKRLRKGTKSKFTLGPKPTK